MSAWLVNAQSLDGLLAKADQNKAVNPDVFQQLITQIEKRQHELNNEQSQFLDYLKTFSIVTQGNYQNAIIKLEEIQNKTDVTKVKVRSLLTLSNIYAFAKQYEKAFTSLNYVTDNISRIADSDLLNVVYLAMSNTYLLTNQYQLSQKYATLVLEQTEDEVIRCRANQYLLSSILKQNNFQSLDYEQVEKVKKLCIKTKQKVVAYFLETALIRAHLEGANNTLSSADLAKFKESLITILTDYKGGHLKSLELMTQSLLAKISFYLNDFVDAERWGLAVLNSQTIRGDHQPKLDALEVLKNIAEQKGDYQRAYGYLSELEAINTELMADNKLKEMAFLHVEHANLARELELEQLNKSNKILKIEQQLAQQNAYNQQLMLLLLLIVLGLTVAWLYRINKRHGALVKVADLDFLTQVYNRSGFEKWANKWLETAKQNQSVLHFAIIDFDHFKSINDQYGHLTGDWVLKYVVNAIKEQLDENMLLGRLGGEEFALLILNQPVQKADRKMHEIRAMIETLDLTGSGHEISITCSFGVTSPEISGYDLVSLLTHADLALYQAKSAGRNQLVRYQQ